MKTLNTISKLTTIISITAAALYVVSVAIENRRLDKEIADTADTLNKEIDKISELRDEKSGELTNDQLEKMGWGHV